MLTRRSIQQLLGPYVDDGQLPGYVAVISRRGHRTVAYGGFSDLSTRATMHETRVFRWASLTKPIAAILACVATERGELDLGAPITQYLPQQRGYLRALPTPDTEYTARLLPSGAVTDDAPTIPAAAPTVAQLLKMTAGFGYEDNTDQQRAYREIGIQSGTQYLLSTNQFASRLLSLPLAAKPGTRWIYNWSIDVLALVLEAATGLPVDQQIRKRITAPLELRTVGYNYTLDDPATSLYRSVNGQLLLEDPEAGTYLRAPEFHPLHTGLVGTAGEYVTIFEDLLRDRPRTCSYRALTCDTLAGELGFNHPHQTFGYCVSISEGGDITPPGTFGWAGITGVKALAHPGSGTVAALFTNLVNGQQPRPWFDQFFEAAFQS